MREYNNALQLAPQDAETWFQRGNVFLEQDKLPEAEADFTKAIELNAEHAKAWMNRGVTRYSLARLDDAMQDLAQARELDGNIVIPGLDWMQAGTVTEVIAAKPVLAPAAVTGNWEACLQFVEAQLATHGYDRIETIDNMSEINCARLQARRNEQTTDVFVALATAADVSDVIIPSPTGTSVTNQAKLALFIVCESASEEPDAEAFAVLRFEEDWDPTAETLAPLTSRLSLPPAAE